MNIHGGNGNPPSKKTKSLHNCYNLHWGDGIHREKKCQGRDVYQGGAPKITSQDPGGGGGGGR